MFQQDKDEEERASVQAPTNRELDPVGNRDKEGEVLLLCYCYCNCWMMMVAVVVDVDVEFDFDEDLLEVLEMMKKMYLVN